jgi:hypothetical protein
MLETAIILPGGHTAVTAALFAEEAAASAARFAEGAVPGIVGVTSLVEDMAAFMRGLAGLTGGNAAFMRGAAGGDVMIAAAVLGGPAARLSLTTHGNSNDCKGEELDAGSFFHLEVPKSSLSREIWVAAPAGV